MPIARAAPYLQTGGTPPQIVLARYYEPALARFLSVDPVVSSRANTRAPQRWNRHTYSLNNPLKYLDANGKDLSLAVGGPTDNNGYGHVAVIHNDTVYSAGSTWSGPKGDWGVSAKSYFNTASPETGKTQDQSRQTTIIKLKATPEQEAAVVQNLQKGPGDTGVLTNNCAQRSEGALEAGGVLPVTFDVKAAPQGDMAVRTDPQATTPEGLQTEVEAAGGGGI